MTVSRMRINSRRVGGRPVTTKCWLTSAGPICTLHGVTEAESISPCSTAVRIDRQTTRAIRTCRNVDGDRHRSGIRRQIRVGLQRRPLPTIARRLRVYDRIPGSTSVSRYPYSNDLRRHRRNNGKRSSGETSPPPEHKAVRPSRQAGMRSGLCHRGGCYCSAPQQDAPTCQRLCTMCCPVPARKGRCRGTNMRYGNASPC